MQNVRMTRLAHQFQQEIATIIHQELKDPRLGFVTITRVTLTNDLRYATAFFSCLGGGEERGRSQEALDHASGFVHGLLKKRFRLKVVPEIRFKYDESIEAAFEIERLFDKLGKPPEAS